MENSLNDNSREIQISCHDQEIKNREANDKIQSLENIIRNKDLLCKQILEENKIIIEQWKNSEKTPLTQESKNPIEQVKYIQRQDVNVKNDQKNISMSNWNINECITKVHSKPKLITDTNNININLMQKSLHTSTNNNRIHNIQAIGNLNTSKIIPTESSNQQNTNTNSSYLLTSKTSISQYQKNPDHTLIGPIATHPLSLKNLLDIIHDIYNSKTISDHKLQLSHLQKETMEQYMYTYLKNKYGLKSLVIEWASGIIKGIKAYSYENSEICLFGKILRNEIEEGEILVIKKLKETISLFLSHYIQKKYSLMSKSEIDKLVNKIKTGYLSEEEWSGISSYLFSEPDLILLNEKIIRFIRGNSNSQMNGNKILYQRFILWVIEFQIRLRNNFLRNFNEFFYSVDKDRKGFLSKDEFYIWIERMNVYNNREERNENAKRMIDIWDPYNSGVMLYSDIIDLFSKEEIYELIPEEGEIVKLSILEKTSIQYEDNKV